MSRDGLSYEEAKERYDYLKKLYDDYYNQDNKKLELLHNRLKMVCAGQSRQIDKAKMSCAA